jgi:hypothetical protein
MILMSFVLGLAAAAAAAVLVPKLVKDHLDKQPRPQPIPVRKN